jgi:hypothetical protein
MGCLPRRVSTDPQIPMLQYSIMSSESDVPPDDGARQGSHRAASDDKVDPAALGLAGLAAILAFTIGPGDWDGLSLVFGLALTFVVLGYHQPTPGGTPTFRVVIQRLAFASFLSLAIGLCLAWPLQSLILQPLDPAYLPGSDEHVASGRATIIILIMWFPLTAVFAHLEPRLNRLLSRCVRP